jgi:hypothetical protein
LTISEVSLSIRRVRSNPVKVRRLIPKKISTSLIMYRERIRTGVLLAYVGHFESTASRLVWLLVLL